MSEPQAPPAVVEAGEPGVPKPGEDGWKPPATQADLDRIIESRIARERAKLPTDYDQLKSEVEQLRTEKLSADEKAIQKAQKEAAQAAAETAKAEYLPKIQALEVKAIASTVINGDRLNAFMELVNPSVLVGEDGAVDETKVMGFLTAMYANDEPAAPQVGQRWQNAGQHAPPPPRGNRVADEVAHQMKRLGIKPT